jgi:MFS family permease
VALNRLWNSIIRRVLAYLPDLDFRVWLLMAGRLLSQLGTGFTLFYAPIFFVNQVGLSATAVGIGIGSGSISGVVGRILGGSMCDSPQWGRRQTLLLSAAISAIADVFLVLANDLPVFILGNLLMGLGIGLYWPATEAVVADLTTAEQRNEAFALTRLGDSLGLGLGVIFGGALISLTGNYRALFVIDGISFLVFFGLIYWAIAETLAPDQPQRSALKGWTMALSDRLLLIYVLVNILFTTYLAQIQSALPIYLSSLVPRPDGTGFDASTISLLFTWHVVLTALLQLPVARSLNGLTRPQALMISSLSWGIGYVLLWVTGTMATGNLIWAVLGLTVMAIATVAYLPSASSFVVTLAPVSLRGVYLSINSLCWAAGYFIGPTLGGWAMDQPKRIADGFWLASAASILLALGILRYLDLATQTREDEPG